MLCCWWNCQKHLMSCFPCQNHTDKTQGWKSLGSWGSPLQSCVVPPMMFSEMPFEEGHWHWHTDEFAWESEGECLKGGEQSCTSKQVLNKQQPLQHSHTHTRTHTHACMHVHANREASYLDSMRRGYVASGVHPSRVICGGLKPSVPCTPRVGWE